MKENKALNITLTIIRIFVGVLFIFSGLIKANDPSGLAYKMGEFFEVWAKEGYAPSLMHWLNNYSLLFSILMIAFEIVAGVALIIGYRFKLFAYLILLLTIFFTFLTGYALFSGNIKECGCFGDCIKLQANESFMKDLILLALLLILVLFRKRIKQSFGNGAATAVMVVSLILSFWMQWYVLKHLPFKDCLAYRVGNNILKEMTPGKDYVPAKFETILTYEKDGVKRF
ncbi:MAG: DoxX family protein [Bacteroidetes bacterium]|nr:DoxX family protein [Bacteroidota bacterium]